MDDAEWELGGLSERWAREQQVPGWQSISLRLPPAGDATVTFAIDESSGAARPDKRSQLTLDLNTGEVVRWEPYASHNLGRQIRLWIWWVHTGEAGGIAGQTVAGIVVRRRRGTRLDRSGACLAAFPRLAAAETCQGRGAGLKLVTANAVQLIYLRCQGSCRHCFNSANICSDLRLQTLADLHEFFVRDSFAHDTELVGLSIN
ncbi:MAG: hypothetical protein WD696_05915 [Bryobacteraceae bacterium]